VVLLVAVKDFSLRFNAGCLIFLIIFTKKLVKDYKSYSFIFYIALREKNRFAKEDW